MKLCPKCHNGLTGSPSRCSVCTEDLSRIEGIGGDGLAGMRVGDGRYELVSLLGEGGMAWVYRGIHKNLHREVAVKLLKPVPKEMVAEQRGRFEREARLASRLNHPHILATIDFGETKTGIKFLVTEFIEGKSLHHVMWENEEIPLSRVVDIFHQMLAAIDEAHSKGVIHRDIKPENIIVNKLRSGEDFVKVLDFGIAVLTGRADGRVTQAGAFIGTPGFMSTEQIMGKDATERSDIYALGAVLYEMLTGIPLYDDETPMALINKQLTEEYTPIKEACPGQLDRIAYEDVVARSVAKDPAERYTSISELRDDLRAVTKLNEFGMDCSTCSRPVDPATGLCHLHRGSLSPPPIAIGAIDGASQMGSVDTIASVPPGAPSSGFDTAGTTRFKPVAGIQLRASMIQDEEVVGRDKEYARVTEFFSSEENVLIVTGEAGSGKTTLLRGIELAGSRELDVPVYRMFPDPFNAYTSWYPVRNLVGRVLECGPNPKTPFENGAVSPGIEGMEDPAVGLNILFGFSVGGAPADSAHRRNSVHLAVLFVLLGKTKNGLNPVVIAEDVDKYDKASLDFLRSLGGLARETQLKVVVSALRDPGGFAGAHSTLHLGPLNKGATDSLVERLFSDSRDTVRRMGELVGESGNPAHAMAAWRLMREGGEPSGTIDDIAMARVQALPEDSALLLQTIAMLGRSVSLPQLERLSGNEQMFLALQVLIQRGIVESTPDKSISVTDPIVADAALEALSPTVRRELAGRIFERFEQEKADVFVLARLARRAKKFESAVKYLERAGDAACKREDLGSAAMIHYREAVHLVRWELLMSEEDETYLRISLKMGKALSLSGHRKSAEVVLKDVIAAGSRHPAFVAQAREVLA